MVYNLFKALWVLNQKGDKSANMSKYIGRRLIFSVLIVLILLVGILTGFITPNPKPI